MRVLLVVDLLPPAGGGTGAHALRLAHALVDRGIEVRVITVGDSTLSATLDGLAVRRVRLSVQVLPGAHMDSVAPFAPPWRDPALARAIGRAVEEFRPQVVHAHGWSEMTASPVAAAHGIPLVVTLHDYGRLCPQKNLLNGGGLCGHTASPACVSCGGSEQSVPKRLALAGALRLSNRQAPAAAYIAVSRFVADRHVASHLFASQGGMRIEVIPNFIDDLSGPSADYPVDGSILFVGGEKEHKGLPILEQAHRVLIDGGRPRVLHHVGGETVGAANFMERSGRLTGQALIDAYQRASVVVAPAVYPDPCPTVVLEAMAAARPVIATNLGGHPDMIDRASGVLVAPGNSAELAAALARVLDDPASAAAMGLAGRDQVKDFTTSQIVPRIVAVYGQAVAAHAGRSREAVPS